MQASRGERTLSVELVFAICELRFMDNMKPSDLVAATGISMSYASEIIRGLRTPSRPLAIKIFRITGHKIGPLANASDADIEVLARLEGEAAA